VIYLLIYVLAWLIAAEMVRKGSVRSRMSVVRRLDVAPNRKRPGEHNDEVSSLRLYGNHR
jgi:hypothetical protein